MGNHGIIAVNYPNNPCQNWRFLPNETIGIAGSIIVLMVMQDDEYNWM
jgi:hypothetical protein